MNEIVRCMAKSCNADYSIAIIPKCGHAPVNVDTKQLVRIDHVVINWLSERGVGTCERCKRKPRRSFVSEVRPPVLEFHSRAFGPIAMRRC